MQLSFREVSKLFRVPENTIYRWIEEEKLPALQMDGQCRFNRNELVDWATTHHHPIPPELLATDTKGLKNFTLSQALELGGVFHGLNGKDKPSVLRAVADAMPLPSSVDRDFLWQMLLARESQESTGLGDGIAVPHVRNPMVLPVSQAMVSLYFVDPPVEFDALDGKPVFALFSIICTNVQEHLQLLARIAFALKEAGFRETINRRGSREEVLEAARRAESQIKTSPSPAAKG